MSLLKSLAAQTLLGSERKPAQLPAFDGALGQTILDISGSDIPGETQVLRTAGVLSLYSQAGYAPSTVQQTLCEPCTPEALQPITQAAVLQALQEIIALGPQILLKEALLLVQRKQKHLPPSLLPALFNLGKSAPLLAPSILSASGHRGLWLAQLNDEWRYLLHGQAQLPRDLWEHGNTAERLAFIAQLRAQNPAEARTLIKDALTDLDARDRSSFISILRSGLSASDETFIEEQLRDRSKEVRLLAADLLAHLPDSAFVKRMQERLNASLSQERKLFRRQWKLEPPEQFAADWKADALEEGRTQSESLGPKAWWLFQIARATPLAWWEQHLELSPDELLAWALGSDWSLALIRAWHQALLREKNVAWAQAFLQRWPFKEFNYERTALIAFLPQQQREHYWYALLDGGEGYGPLLEQIVSEQSQLAESMSADFSNKVLKLSKKYLTQQRSRWDYPLRQSLVDFVCLIPPACFHEATHSWPIDSSDSQAFGETIARILAIVEQRKTLFQFLASDF